jgi:hypothetical protein
MQINTQSNPNAPGFNDVSVGKYDFFVEEGIETVNSRNSVAQMLIDLSQNSPGSVPPDLIAEYSGAPFSVKQQLQQYTAQVQQSAMKAEQEKTQREYELEMAKLENQRYIAVINNVTKLITSDKKVDADIIKTMMTGVHQKEIAQITKNKESDL